MKQMVFVNDAKAIPELKDVIYELTQGLCLK